MASTLIHITFISLNSLAASSESSSMGVVFFFFIAVFLMLGFVRLTNEQDYRQQKQKPLDNFPHILILLAATVIKSDGRIYKKEKQLVRQRLAKSFNAKLVNKYMDDLNLCLKKRINSDEVCKRLKLRLVHSEKIQLLYFIVELATSNGKLTDNEHYTLRKIALSIGIPERSFVSILAMFRFERINDFKQKSSSNRKRTSRSSTSYSELERAYQILELDSSASADEIKKAYRKLAKEHHPDRVIHLGEEFQKNAKAKFQKISNAYELIKSKKQFV